MYCATCVLFLNIEEAGKGNHEKIETFVSKPYRNLMKALQSFRKHEKTEYHRSAVTAEDNIEALIQKKSKA